MMENQKHSKVFTNVILRIMLIIRFAVGSATSNQVSTTAVQLHSKVDELNFNIRLLGLETKSKYQEDEIAALKFLRMEDAKVVNQLRNRVDQLEASVPKTSENENILERQKRPFRLAPISSRRGKEDNLDEEINVDRKFYGPATSCEELGLLGYTLNGYYIVKRKSQSSSSGSKKIEVIFCQFFQPYNRGTKEVVENRLGFLKVMDKPTVSGIYFYVQRQGMLPAAPDGIIRFTKVRLNIGGAMNMGSGIFTAPKAGIYHFSVTITKEGYSLDGIWIFFRVNGIKISMSGVGATVGGAPATIQPTLKLKKGDRVDLWKDNSFGTMEYRSGQLIHHFTGWLLEEEEEDEE